MFIVIGTLNNKNLTEKDFFRIEEILVKGLDKKDDFELKKSLKFLKSNNIFFLNKIKINEIVYSNSLIENYFITKKYPSSLLVEINKTNFLAILKKDNEFFFLGSNGKLIKKTSDEINLPFIFGNFENQNFFELKKIIDETGFNYVNIKNLFFFKSGRWDIETKDGLLVKLPKDELKKTLKLYLNFISENKNEKFDMIDLRQPDKIIING